MLVPQGHAVMVFSDRADGQDRGGKNRGHLALSYANNKRAQANYLYLSSDAETVRISFGTNGFARLQIKDTVVSLIISFGD